MCKIFEDMLSARKNQDFDDLLKNLIMFNGIYDKVLP